MMYITSWVEFILNQNDGELYLSPEVSNQKGQVPLHLFCPLIGKTCKVG